MHEYDTCCFSPHNRHEKLKAYESNIRAELTADGRAEVEGHGWFTATADNHSKHEVCDQDKAIITAALAGGFKPGADGWDSLPCDILHQALPANCPQNRDPGLPPGWPGACTRFPTKLPVCPKREDSEGGGGSVFAKVAGAVAGYFAEKEAGGTW